MTKRLALIAVVLFLCAAGVIAGMKILPRVQSYLERREREHVVLPPPTKPERIVASASASSFSSSASSFSSVSLRSEKLPSAINWDVPFTPQAPFALWDHLHEEACEEASVLMVLKYFRGERIASPEDAERDIQALVKVNAALGFPVDDTAEQVAVLLRSEEPGLFSEILRDPTVDMLKRALSEGALIIVPAAGRELGNPYFRRPGPLYHMLVLRGYTADGYVITNDPGTKRGEQFVYRWERLMEAMHDWNNGDVEHGQKVVVVVRGTGSTN